MSDFYRREVLSIDRARQLAVRAYVGGQPSGLGFRPDGTPLVASVYDRNVLAITSHHLQLIGSPGKVVVGPTNDMAVDREGRAYVTGFGYEAFYEGYDESRTTRIARVDLDGSVSLQGGDLYMPNGIVFTPDGKRLIVSETPKNRLTQFDVSPEGALSGQRVFAELGANRSPDGLSIDVEGGVWVACWKDGVLVRVAQNGEITEEIVASTSGAWVPSCALGGPNGHTLYWAVSNTDLNRAIRGISTAIIQMAEVDVPAWH